MSTSQLVWVITGTSTGIGRDLAIAALKRGDKVVATARGRSFHKLDDLKAQGAKTLELDVTADLNTIKTAAKTAVGYYGRVNVLVNNAGYAELGALEENTGEETFNQFNTNVFGGLQVARAFLPYMREKKTGTIAWIGSLGGWRPNPTGGLYGATKFAIRSLSETLHEEISPLGLRSICFDFGYFRTEFLTSGHIAEYEPRIEDYKPITQHVIEELEVYNGKQPGDPKKGASIIIDVIRGEGVALGKTFPTVLALGGDCAQVVKTSALETLKRVEEWEEVSKSTNFSD